MAFAVCITESRPEAINSQPVTRQALRLPRPNGRRGRPSSARPGSLPPMWNSRLLNGGVIARSDTSITIRISDTTEPPFQSFRRLHVTDRHAITGRFLREDEPHFFEWNSDVTDDFYCRLTKTQ
jgi:hypothetical protein